jgi:hypothetical protein
MTITHADISVEAPAPLNGAPAPKAQRSADDRAAAWRARAQQLQIALETLHERGRRIPTIHAHELTAIATAAETIGDVV